ncbi:MAG: alanine racemase [Nitrospira sp.]|nr:alanine racemase [Nitrospira sp.]
MRQRAPRSEVLAVVKADAYGHGALEITRALHHLGVRRFGVATIDEGISLREAGILDSILVMGPTVAAQFPDLIAHQLTPVLYRADLIRSFAAAVGFSDSGYTVHVKVDTGMGRLGIAPEELATLVAATEFQSPLRLGGLMTHLADADNYDATETEAQLARFQAALTILHQSGTPCPLIHAANSAAIIRFPKAHYSLVRPGIMLYGYHTIADAGSAPELHPILTWRATIAHLRTLQVGDSVSYNRTFIASRRTRIAVLPVGYADGYNRLLSNKASVLINGRRVPVVGRICMDMTMVDVTDIPGVEIGQEAVLIGTQGEQRITATDLAMKCSAPSVLASCVGIDQILATTGNRVRERAIEPRPRAAIRSKCFMR